MPTPVLLLLGDSQIHDYLTKLLQENHYFPLLVHDSHELIESLKEKRADIILIDCGAVTLHGIRLIPKIKVSCPRCRIIIFCDKEHLCDKAHRELIKEILNIGVYACILTPYKDWEILSLISHCPK